MRGEVCYTLKKGWMYASSVGNTIVFLKNSFSNPLECLFLSKMDENGVWFHLLLAKTDENDGRFRLFLMKTDENGGRFRLFFVKTDENDGRVHLIAL